MFRNLIRADRTGDWDLNVKSVELLMPIFSVFDRSKYSRWLPLYYYDISTLKENKPEVYEQFKQGNFVHKKSLVPFKSVPFDQTLEQSINRSQKSNLGTIGCTQNKNLVTAWNLNYHEILAISNYHRKVTNVEDFSLP